MPVSNVLKFVKSTRTTLVIFFIYDVDLGLFIFIILHPYKTLNRLSVDELNDWASLAADIINHYRMVH